MYHKMLVVHLRYQMWNILLINIFPGQGLTVGFDEAGRIFGYSGLNRFLESRK